MPSTLLGLPTHPLVVHAVVVLVPLACVMAIASAASARFRHWARWATPAVAVVAALAVPVATSTGEGLERGVPHSTLVEQHARLGDTLLPLMGAVALLAVVLAWLHRRGAKGVPIVAVSLLVGLASVGTLVQVARIGHTGASAVWHGTKVPPGGEHD